MASEPAVSDADTFTDVNSESLHDPECLFLLVLTSCTLLTLFCTLQHFWGGCAQALERQKEYTDAIRTERDELREEVVKLKDILKVPSVWRKNR